MTEQDADGQDRPTAPENQDIVRGGHEQVRPEVPTNRSESKSADDKE
jgi:hypothetical protein